LSSGIEGLGFGARFSHVHTTGRDEKGLAHLAILLRCVGAATVIMEAAASGGVGSVVTDRD